MPGPWSTGGAQRRRIRRESAARSTGRELRSGDGKALKPQQGSAVSGVLAYALVPMSLSLEDADVPRRNRVRAARRGNLALGLCPAKGQARPITNPPSGVLHRIHCGVHLIPAIVFAREYLRRRHVPHQSGVEGTGRILGG